MGAELRLDVSDLLASPGTRRSFSTRTELEGLELTWARVVDATVDVDIELESTSTTVSVSGVVLFESSAECRRCLGGVSDSHRVEVREVFEDHWTEGETYALIPHAAGTMIDLEPMVREAVLLTLPLAPLCGPSCVGPDPDRFPTGPASESAPARDPRWAALDELDLN